MGDRLGILGAVTAIDFFPMTLYHSESESPLVKGTKLLLKLSFCFITEILVKR